MLYQALSRLDEALTSSGFSEPTQPDKTYTQAIIIKIIKQEL